MSKLRTYYKKNIYEAGCDEAGRGPLAGPVFAAAVILDPSKTIKGLNDSKLLSAEARLELAAEIEQTALAWEVASVGVQEIDTINILQASLKAMFLCIQRLNIRPELVLVDGNKPIPCLTIPQMTVVKGDALYQSIAAASILAKVYRDRHMLELHEQYPHYGWRENKGYPTAYHRMALNMYGPSPYHRRSFRYRKVNADLFPTSSSLTQP